MKEYHWTIESSGIIEAESYEDEKKELEKHAEHYVLDDQKYWRIKIDKSDKEVKMPKAKIHVKHRDEIYQKLLDTYKHCVNRKVRSAISDEDYGYAKALEWVLGLPLTIVNTEKRRLNND